MEEKLTVSISPHIREDISIRRIMYSVVVALLPALFFSIYIFRMKVLTIVLLSIGAAVGSETLCQYLFKRKITITDGSAVITGILLAFNLPPGSPFWLPIIGSIFAVVIAKQLFGGLGYNFINPALAGRAFLMASWPKIMTHAWEIPTHGTLSGIDAITSATPLTVLKEAKGILADPLSSAQSIATAKQALFQLGSKTSLSNLFFGSVGGCIGETSALFLLIGAVFLLVKKYIDWKIPLSYIGTVFILTLFIPTGINSLFHILSGGLVLGAFFMATDMVTSPVTPKGRWIFGIGCGAITVLIRLWGGYPEGVSYSILLMNCATPLIDIYTKPKKFGVVKKKATTEENTKEKERLD